MNENEQELNAFLVQAFHGLLRAEEHSLSAVAHNLSLKELHVIEVVALCAQQGDNRATRIAQMLGVTPGTLTTAVNLLVLKGYLIRAHDARDRRVKRIELTAQGQLANEAHQRFHREMVRQVLAALPPEEAEVFMRGLRHVCEFFQNEPKKEE